MSRMISTNLARHSMWILGLVALMMASPAWTQNSQFQYVSTSVCWSQANAAAQQAGGHLATISSPDENAAVTSVAGGNRVWIGFTDQVSEGSFAWITGEPVTYTNWNGGEPNNLGGEDYTELLSTGKWNDLPDCATRGYVIEFAAAPVPVMSRQGIIILSGLFLILAWRFRHGAVRVVASK